MAERPAGSYARRNFLVKHWFQVRFALLPISFLAIFLAAGGLYLNWNMRETLEFYLYLPHSRIQTPWEVVAPSLTRVTIWGGASFLLALALWGWRRFTRLQSDLEVLADWAARLPRASELDPLPAMGDAEVRSLGEGLRKAAESLRDWDRGVAETSAAFAQTVRALDSVAGEGLTEGLSAARAAWKTFQEDLSKVRVEEDLS